MTEPARRRWSVQDFFAWQECQDERYELGMSLALADVYDGVVFPPRPRLVSRN